jgi:uncharacterized membrane protein
MGRHADPSYTPLHLARRNPRLLIVVIAALVVLVGGVTGGVVWLVSGSSASSACTSTSPVRVAVTPDLAPVVQKLFGSTVTAADGTCATVRVTAQQPLETVGNLSALEPSALPQVWVPDSSLWAARAGGAQLKSAGSIVTSPVVLATSRVVVDQLGWVQNPPTWGQALASNRPVAVPDLAGSAPGLAALAAVRTSLGGNQNADNAVVAAVLAAQRGPAVSATDALVAGSTNAADAPLVPVSEQQVYATDRAAAHSSLTAVYPTEGTPQLDYPVLRVGRATGVKPAAVDAVLTKLLSAQARAAAVKAGFRDPSGTGPVDAGDGTGIRKVAPGVLPLDTAQVQQLLARLASLASPSRILAVYDISASMAAPVGSGTRATLERDASKSALTLIPNNSSIGVWTFAYHLNGADDWKEIVPVRRLDAQADGHAQRELLSAALDSMPDHLSDGGTGLYDTTLAAVRAVRSSYDPASVNSVLLITDGANDDDQTGLQLDQLVSTLKNEADPAKPVKVIAVGLGPDADLPALRQIAGATNGAAYLAVDPHDLQTVLFDTLRQRG